jgi:hypothetical protein
MQQAQAGIYRGAYGLAGALGGALGAQDPQLQLISTRNSIARQIDYSSPMSIMEGQRTLARLGDTVGALQLANVARDLEYKQAQTSQSLAAAGASRAQAAKSQAEIDEIARQEKAFAALTGKAPAAEATPAADAAPAALGPRTETLLDRAGEPYTVEIGGAISAPVGVMQNIPPSGVMGAPAAAPAAAPTMSQQIAALERQRAQMLALTKVPAAKAEAEVLGDQIKDLRSQLKPTELTNLEREIQQIRSEGVPDTDPRIRTRLDKITKLSSSSAERFGVDREAISQEVYDKPFAQLTQPQRAAVNKRVEDEQGRRAKAGAAVFPGDKALADIPAFRASVQRTIAPQLSTITASKQALQSINDSIATNNFVSFNAARTQLARSLGDSQLSRRDIEQAGGDPSILGSLIDLTSRAFTSTPSIDTQKKIRDTLQAIETVARKQARGEVDQQRKIALRSPGYNAEAVNEALMFPELQGDAAPPPAAAGTPIYARNPTTGARIMSTDGGVNWTSVR